MVKQLKSVVSIYCLVTIFGEKKKKAKKEPTMLITDSQKEYKNGVLKTALIHDGLDGTSNFTKKQITLQQ